MPRRPAPSAPLAIAAFVGLASAAHAQRPPAPRPLGATVATAAEPLRAVAAVRHLPDGRVLVNDPVGRRVVLYDADLKPVAVVADSTSGTANAYGPRPGGLIAYRGDSTLFVDPASLSMLVIDGQGKIARVMSVPRSQDAMALAGFAFGGAAYDGRGRLVYRAFPEPRPRPAANGEFAPPEMPDSAAIVRVDLATRVVDTAAFIRIPKLRMSVTREEGRTTMTSEVNPLPVTDDWAMTSAGQIALVRGRDYHVDWVAPDGARRSSPKIPFEWRRLSDEDKVAVVDSVKAARERMAAEAPAGGTTVTTGDGRQMTMRAPGDGGAGGGPGMRVMVFEGGPGGGPPPRGAAGAAGVRAPRLTYVSPSELPDYQPAFFAGALRADADGNVWVRTIPTTALAGGPVYDVIDADGKLVERVQVPASRTIAGFGAGGVVYLTWRDAAGVHLERARVR